MTLVATSRVGVGPGVKMLDQRSSRKKPIINQVLLPRGLIRGSGREYKQGLAGSSIGPWSKIWRKEGGEREKERGGSVDGNWNPLRQLTRKSTPRVNSGDQENIVYCAVRERERERERVGS